jgi:Zn-dependent protease with chaperone function
MDAIYPAGPTDVPADLSRPTPAYRRHAWLAMAGLALFVVLYLLLSGWFAWTAWHLLSRFFANGAGGFWAFVAGACSAILAVFLLKALFFIKHGTASEDLQITEAEQPRLFAFLHRLADEAGAPRPHRVYLSNRVNAAVFYEISLANLIFPTRKNLEIGLALVNVLSLGELKAVLAHEFGHFAQRTMYVGRWVYIGQQIAAHIIAKRDALDRLLGFISRFDIRVAWVGWILSIIVWSIRSVMETVFRAVIIAQRALSREMEFQADLVAVSLTGSDALVHALHRLTAADDAWSRAVQFAGSELQNGRRVTDVFTLQTRVIEQLSRVLNQPELGKVPPLPAQNRPTHRVFSVQLAQPPRMWLTHPPSSEREDNCKRRYVEAAIDERSAWELFENAPALRQKLSEQLFKIEKPVDAVATEESLKRLDEEFDKPFLNRAYRGCYLGRPVTRHAQSATELYGDAPGPESLLRELNALYPESLSADIETLRDLEEERAILLALQSGALTAPNGIIRHRNKELKRSELQRAIDELGEEVRAALDRVLAHHRRCRTAHRAAAHSLGQGWPEYLEGLVQILHYAEHTEANLLDARGYFGSVFAIVTADRKVTSNELDELVTAGDAVYVALRDIFEQRDQVALDRTITQRLGAESWSQKLEPLGLISPNRQNINSWLQALDGWVGSYASALSALKLRTLEQLLLAESTVAKFVREGMQPTEAPPPSYAPRQFTLRTTGTERVRRTKLSWWDRFQIADGALATVLRLIVAAAIVGAVVITGSRFSDNALAIYNGLGRSVKVSIEGKETSLAPSSFAHLSLPERSAYHVEARTADGQVIESFDGPANEGSMLIYNVAGAAPLVQYTALYTRASNGGGSNNLRNLGAPRWSGSRADYVFAQPPQTISSREQPQKEVVRALSADFAPWQLLGTLKDDAARTAMIKTHITWDDSGSSNFMSWLSLASGKEGFSELLARRLRASPDDVLLRRQEQDSAKGDDYHKVCEHHQAMAAAAPSNGNLQYLATRCIEDGARQASTFLALADRFPKNGWIAAGVGFARTGREEWDEAYRRFQQARNAEPAMAGMLGARLARLRRVTGNEDDAALGGLAHDAPELVALIALETGRRFEGYEPQGAERAYTSLAHGDLAEALKTARSDHATYARVLRLAAASDGADASMVREALALPADEGIDEITIWYALALAARERADTAPLLKYLDAQPEQQTQPLARFFNSIRGRTVDVASVRTLDLQTPEERGMMYAMAATLRSNAAPAEWRWLASKLLFAPERPFYRVTRAPTPNDDVDAELQKKVNPDTSPGNKGNRTRARLAF